jgi:ribosome-associated protein
VAVKKAKKKAAPKKTAAKKKVSVKAKKTRKVAAPKPKAQKKVPVASKKKLKKKIIVEAPDLQEDLETLTADEIDQELEDYDRTPKPESAPILRHDLKSQELAQHISQLMFEKKAENVVMADLEGLTSVTDYFVIGTAGSDLHAKAIADHVADSLADSGVHAHHREGYTSLRWILIDYVDVIVHIFQQDAREFYDLERLWGDAQFTKMQDKG